MKRHHSGKIGPAQGIIAPNKCDTAHQRAMGVNCLCLKHNAEIQMVVIKTKYDRLFGFAGDREGADDTIGGLN